MSALVDVGEFFKSECAGGGNVSGISGREGGQIGDCFASERMTEGAHVAREFKKEKRVSPSQYRKAVRGKLFSPI